MGTPGWLAVESESAEELSREMIKGKALFVGEGRVEVSDLVFQIQEKLI